MTKAQKQELGKRIASVAVALAGAVQLMDSPIHWDSPQMWAGLILVAVPAFYSHTDIIRGVKKDG